MFEVHDRARKALSTAGVAAADMAEYAGVTPETMSRYLNGRTRFPVGTLRLIAVRTGVPFTWIQTGEAPSPDGDGASECARRDSNPKPSGLEFRGAFSLVAA